MKSSEILKKARKLVANDSFWLICNAVHAVGVKHKCIVKSDEIKSFVSRQLAGYSSFYDWLKKNHGISGYSDCKKFKQTRLAWIDWMIASYEEKATEVQKSE